MNLAIKITFNYNYLQVMMQGTYKLQQWMRYATNSRNEMCTALLRLVGQINLYEKMQQTLIWSLVQSAIRVQVAVDTP